jgi:peptide-methionine (S)-S-oxide reductase
MAETSVATFGAGCFWGIEDAFRKLPGVTDAVSGYMGGWVDNPTYRMVCTDKTGHAEVVRVEYDPAKVTYKELLDLFWTIHDPTTPNRQGFDVGTQYRSAIFYHDEDQRALAEASKKRLDESHVFRYPIVTEIKPAGAFYRAEEYHQRYYEKSGMSAHCAIPNLEVASVLRSKQ